MKGPSIVRRNNGEDNERYNLILHAVKPGEQITLRDLLANTSGLDDDDYLIKLWEADVTGEKYQKDEYVDFPTDRKLLVDKPGESWSYSPNARWVVSLIEQLNQQPMAETVQELIFDALGMSSSVYEPFDNAEITSRLLQPVERTEGGLEAVGVEDFVACGVVTTINDLSLLLSDLVSPDCSILKPSSVESFFSCNLNDDACRQFRTTKGIFTAYAGIPEDELEPPINYSLGGLIVEEELPLSKMPPWTVTWNGMPNVVWAVNRKYGLGMIWATQLFPENDKKCVDIAMEFFRGAWKKFSPDIDPGSKVGQTSMDEGMADSGFETQTPSDNDAMELNSSHSDGPTTQTPTATTPSAGKRGKRKSSEIDSMISPASKASKRWPPIKISLEDDLDDDMDLKNR